MSAFPYLFLINFELLKLKYPKKVSNFFLLAILDIFLEGSTPKTLDFEKFFISFKNVPSLLPASTTKEFGLI